ncbi:hypothetical protein HYX18_00550 [Candidatus Woesearchaeota archaeon]|nr:hypothetical protein [Candidatus Woesearchaeota archaeon]
MVANETINQTFEVAQGTIQYSPPPSTSLTTNIILMVVFFLIILSIYIRIQIAKKNKPI